MKLNIKNLLFQPLALHLATDGEGLHLSARECREILAEHVSDEIQLAAARGLVSLVNKPGDSEDHAVSAEVGVDTPESAVEVGEQQARQKKGKLK
ncbi:hypothetical protein LLG46_03580 [bacterium]|nr:hypothetical protein [bacterium]